MNCFTVLYIFIVSQHLLPNSNKIVFLHKIRIKSVGTVRWTQRIERSNPTYTWRYQYCFKKRKENYINYKWYLKTVQKFLERSYVLSIWHIPALNIPNRNGRILNQTWTSRDGRMTNNATINMSKITSLGTKAVNQGWDIVSRGVKMYPI